MAKRSNFYLISHGGQKDPFWDPVRKGMDVAAELLDVDAEYLGPREKEFDADDVFLENLEKALRGSPSGIAVTVPKSKELHEKLSDIAERIAIIAINVPDFTDGEKPYFCYIGMDEYKCGKDLAYRVRIEDGFTPENPVVAFHEFHDGLERRKKGIQDVLSRVGIQTDTIDIFKSESREAKLGAYFDEHPKTNTVFALGPLGAHAVLKVLKANKLDKVKVATVDLTEETVKALKDGRVICSAYQSPFLQGFLPILLLHKLREGKVVRDRNIWLGPLIADKYNVDGISQMEKIVPLLF